jgi:hypothetical protein
MAGRFALRVHALAVKMRVREWGSDLEFLGLPMQGGVLLAEGKYQGPGSGPGGGQAV